MTSKVLLFLAVGLFLAPVFGTEEEREFVMNPLNQQRANMNEYMDHVFLGVANWLRDGGLVPMSLPDMTESFSYNPILINYTGSVDLTQGNLLDISDVSRVGDAFMGYDRLLLRIETGAALKSMNFRYDYLTTVMGLGIFEGWIEGYAENIVIHCDFLIDMYDFFIYMQDFRVTSIGRIDVNLRGNILTDWLGNVIIDIVTVLFRTTVTNVVSERVKGFVQEALDVINQNRFTSNSQMKADFLAAVQKQQLKVQMMMPVGSINFPISPNHKPIIRG